MTARPFPPAHPHGPIEELFPDLFWVMGTAKMKRPPVRFSRNMAVLRHGEELTLVNTLRLDESGLAALERLGTVKHVVRLAGFHGMDDPFYKDRYQATVYALRDQVYAAGFDNVKTAPEEGYFHADVALDPDSPLPFPNARIIRIEGLIPEGLLLLEREGGVLVSGDTLQNWDRPDRYFSFLASVVMRLMGFIKPHNVGPGWLDQAKPDPNGIAALLELDFDHVVPVHGSVVRGNAKAKFRPAIEAAVAKRRG